MKRRRYPRFDELRPSSSVSSYCKKQTSSKNTTPERLLQVALLRSGLRFKKNSKIVVGKPDLIFVDSKVAVFVDGDFWHGKNWRKRRSRLSSCNNRAYWIEKIKANIRRDRQVSGALRKAGWTVLRFWESDVRSSLDAISQKVFTIVKERSLGEPFRRI